MFSKEGGDCVKPIISIIVPVYNTSKLLDRCMESLLKQTYENIEIILIDDGSTDESSVICDSYASLDKRVSVIHKKNEGLGMARNTGIDAACGEYIGFVDSDDYVDINMYQSLFNAIKENEADTSYCRYFNVTNKGEAFKAEEKYKLSTYRDHQVQLLLLGMIGSSPEASGDVEIGMSVWKGLFSADIIRKNNIRFFSERQYISEDIIFHIDYLKKSQCVAIVQHGYYFYCDNSNSLTKTYRKDRFDMEKILYKKEIESLSDIFKYDIFITRLNKSFAGRVRRCIKQEIFDNVEKNTVNANIKKICEDDIVKKVFEDFTFGEYKFPIYLSGIFVRNRMIILLKVFFGCEHMLRKK